MNLGLTCFVIRRERACSNSQNTWSKPLSCYVKEPIISKVYDIRRRPISHQHQPSISKVLCVSFIYLRSSNLNCFVLFYFLFRFLSLTNAFFPFHPQFIPYLTSYFITLIILTLSLSLSITHSYVRAFLGKSLFLTH